MIHHRNVVQGSGADEIAPNQPVLAVYVHVVFVAVMALAMLLGPARISVLLTTLGWLVRPILRDLTILDSLVLVTRILVAGQRHDGSIQDLPAAGDVALSIEMTVEQLE